jgi:hypothetical protein
VVSIGLGIPKELTREADEDTLRRGGAGEDRWPAFQQSVNGIQGDAYADLSFQKTICLVNPLRRLKRSELAFVDY